MGITRSGVRMSAGELGCTYASLMLFDDDQEVTEDKIKTVLAAAKIDCEAYWPGLFLRAFNATEGGLAKLVSTPALGGGGGGGPAASGGDDAAAGGDSKKKESSSDGDDMAAPAVSIFGDDGGDDY